MIGLEVLNKLTADRISSNQSNSEADTIVPKPDFAANARVVMKSKRAELSLSKRNIVRWLLGAPM
jgi:hypothetical protein